MNAAGLAQAHWNKTPLYFSEEERYGGYPWLCEAAEFQQHAGERVLEIGCGSGCDLLQFAKHGAIATGVDIGEQHLQLARDRVRGLAAVKYGSAYQLPFDDGSFDYVYSHGVIHHIDTPDLAVRELLRVLRPGGVSTFTYTLCGRKAPRSISSSMGVNGSVTLRTVPTRFTSSCIQDACCANYSPP